MYIIIMYIITLIIIKLAEPLLCVVHCHKGILGGSVVKNPPDMQEMEVRFLGQVDPPWRRKRQPTPMFLPGKSYIQRRLVGYSPWGRKSLTRLSN